MTRELYRRIDGPYNRRNVYGAALAYGPVLSTQPATAAMFEDLLSYSLCHPAPLLTELGLSGVDGQPPPRILLEPAHPTPNLPLTIEARCNP